MPDCKEDFWKPLDLCVSALSQTGRLNLVRIVSNAMSNVKGVLREKRADVLNVEWKIEGFLSLSGRAGYNYGSPVFRFSDSSWILAIFPYSDREADDLDSIGLYLCRVESSPKEIVMFETGIKKANGVLYSQRSCTWNFDKDVKYVGSKFSSRTELLQKKTELLPSDALTISCTLKKLPSPTGLDTLFSDFENMLASGRYSDVTIHVKTKKYKAHKVVLAARSSVFAAMFEHEMAEKKTGVVRISDCDPVSFKEFLHFLYAGRADFTERNVSHLYKIADKYDVKELKWQCVAYMVENLSVNNVCDVAALGSQYSDNALKSSCAEFFKENVPGIISSKWETLMKKNYRLAHKFLKRVAPMLKIGK